MRGSHCTDIGFSTISQRDCKTRHADKTTEARSMCEASRHVTSYNMTRLCDVIANTNPVALVSLLTKATVATIIKKGN